VDRCRAAGIAVPVIPGIMPVLSLRQVQRFGATLPDVLARRLEDAGDQAGVVEALGVDWALAQLTDLLERGSPGYHLYIMNRAGGALALAKGLAGC
jgi:methylenetetrahydrofolate reductase (NADPH)